MEKALFIFRRDLRLEDNTGLIFALHHARQVIPCFIFTPEQIDHNPYRSNRCLQFMIESLEDLDHSLKKKGSQLYLFFGTPEKIVAQCIQTLKIDGVIINRDYSPYSLQRDSTLEKLCQKNQVFFKSFDDLLLHPLEETLKTNGTPYTIFTPFYRHAVKNSVQSCTSCHKDNYYTGRIKFAKKETLYAHLLPSRQLQAKGGRQEALKILQHLSASSDNPVLRNIPSENCTTHLSPHLKFTTCSSREIYHAFAKKFGKGSDLIRALYWREFFTLIAFHFPHVFGHAFKAHFDQLSWNRSRALFRKWCEGRTGFPIVDAGMRELNQTGYMQNRVRMIVASFLVKDLHIDWRWGEKYFAQQLIDYDPAINNGNWQWAASTGCDAQPYFRIFNPWTQQLKFDPKCLYIKQWIPELAEMPQEMIHKWDQISSTSCNYPRPIIDHTKESKKTLQWYSHLTLH